MLGLRLSLCLGLELAVAKMEGDGFGLVARAYG